MNTPEATRGQVLRRLKLSLFCRGVRLTAATERALTRNGAVPLTVHEYATTGGLTLRLMEGDVWVNAPFDEDFCDPEVTLVYDEAEAPPLRLQYAGEDFPAELVPLPGYLGRVDSAGRPVTSTTFSHADRVRVSPVFGCSYNCAFCDIPGSPYVRRPLEQILEGIEVAKADTEVPVVHGLVSGGTPSPRDYAYWDETCLAIFARSGLPFDVMMPPRPSDPTFFERLAVGGVHGLAINLEVFDDQVARRIAPQKHRLGLRAFGDAISQAVTCTGGNGRVRSLIVAGLESAESTLRGVEFLAERGCDPVLSPFRPSRGTGLERTAAPTMDWLEDVYLRAHEIAERHGVKLGPRCIPCQHNTLTFPDASGAYFYSKDITAALP